MNDKLKVRHTTLHSEDNKAAADVWWKPLDVTFTDSAFENIDTKIYAFTDECPLALEPDGADGYELVRVCTRVANSIEATVYEEARNVIELKNLHQGTFTAHAKHGEIRMAFTNNVFMCRLDIDDNLTLFDDTETIEVSENE